MHYFYCNEVHGTWLHNHLPCSQWTCSPLCCTHAFSHVYGVLRKLSSNGRLTGGWCGGALWDPIGLARHRESIITCTTKDPIGLLCRCPSPHLYPLLPRPNSVYLTCSYFHTSTHIHRQITNELSPRLCDHFARLSWGIHTSHNKCQLKRGHRNGYRLIAGPRVEHSTINATASYTYGDRLWRTSPR